jgi:hypothetical protein
MKALSLWQPWATAIAMGAKLVETRAWTIPYRGPLAIHAGKSDAGAQLILASPSARAVWRAVLACNTDSELKRKLLDELPRGALLCTIDLVDILPIEKAGTHAARRYHLHGRSWCENDLGDYRAGRSAWLLAEPSRRLLPEPVPCRGHQMLFDVPDNLVTPPATVV